MKYMRHLLMTTALSAVAPMVFDGVSLELSYDDEASIPEGYKALYTEKDGKFTLTAVKGLKTQNDVNKINEALRKERNDHSTLRANLRGAFGEQYNLEDITARLGRIEELEALVEAGGDPKNQKKIDELVAAKVKVALAGKDREIATLSAQVGTLKTENEGFKTAGKTRTIHDAVREAAGKLKVLPGALDDVLIQGERFLEVAEDGTVVTREGPSVAAGLTPVDWLTDLQETKSHWWGASAGGGAGGGGLKTGEKNPWTRDNWNLTQQGALVRANPTRAKALAEAAGTKIGGGMPPQKK